jgi:hypothetical protein
MATKFSKTATIQSGRGLMKKGGSMKKMAAGGTPSKPIAPSKPVERKPVEKKTNIYGKNPATGKEEQMVMKAGKYAYASKKKGGATKSKKK